MTQKSFPIIASLFFTFILVFNANVKTFSQITRLDSMVDFILDSDDEEDILSLLSPQKKNFHALYVSSDFNNKTTYAGREIGSNQYNISGQLFYFNSLGFYGGLSGAWYSEAEPKYSTTVLTAGYGRRFTKTSNFRYRASYSRYFFNDSDYDPTYKNAIGLGLSYRKKYIGSRINTTFMVGDEIGFQAGWDLYFNFDLYKFNKYNKISFRPEISIFYGKETIVIDNATGITDISSLYEEETLSYQDKFGLLNTQIELPINISYKNFDFGISYKYNLPNTSDQASDLQNTSLINISIGYIISLGN